MSQEKIPVSVCLIVKNEADRLEKTLAPFVGRVDEILAYDSGSTDATIEILKKNNVTVTEGPWLGFSATRRALWAMARHPWILWVDADEIFHDESLKEIEKIIEQNPNPEKSEIKGYKVRRQVIFEGKRIRHGDWGCDWVLRLFPANNYFMQERLVHESVTVPGPVRDLSGIVEHHSFRSWADLQARSIKYAQLWAYQNYKAKKRPGIPFINAAWKFFRGYLLKSGWLDGPLGFRIALHNASEVFHKHLLLQDLYRKPAVEPVRADR